MSTSTNDPSQENRQQQLQHLLSLIESQASDSVPGTVGELAKAMTVTEATVRRLLSALLWSGQVERIPTGGRRAVFRRRAEAELQPKDTPSGDAPAGAADDGAAEAPGSAPSAPPGPAGLPRPPGPSSPPGPPAPPPGSPPGTPAGMPAQGPGAAPMPAGGQFDPRQLDRTVISIPLASSMSTSFRRTTRSLWSTCLATTPMSPGSLLASWPRPTRSSRSR